MWNLKYGTHELVYKTVVATVVAGVKNRLVVDKREEGGSGWPGSLGLILHLEWISNEVLLYSTGNYIQSLWVKIM